MMELAFLIVLWIALLFVFYIDYKRKRRQSVRDR
jgi:hypothetical protein